MAATLALGLLFVVACLLAGHVVLRLLGANRPTWMAGAVGFAALTVAAALLVRLPGRATTAAIVIALAVAAGWLWARRSGGPAPGRQPWRGAVPGIAVAVIVLAAASLPFVLHGGPGVLGEGIYTNDHAAQLYWTDWLKEGFGPEPSAVSFGYPVGPQSLVAIAAEITGASLIDAFNGLLLATAALTGLTALSLLGGLRPLPRIATASLAGLPYLAASFLAQSAFKETAMALLVLGFASSLALAVPAQGTPVLGRRAAAGCAALLALAGAFAYSVPGLVWFGLVLAGWLALEILAGRRGLDLGALREALWRRRWALAAAGVALLAIAAVSAGRISDFVERVGDVQASAGRLSSPVFPGEALGIWPEGDFRVVRGEVSGAWLATGLAVAGVAAGAFLLLRRGAYALLAALGAAAAVYVGARAFGSIHVEAKALAVLAPIATLVAVGGLYSARSRLAGLFATVLVVAGGASTFLALREAPVGFDDRGQELESLAERIEGESVVFLGVDRFAAYWMRGTLIRSPGGYVPPEVRARPEKVWQQGDPMDLDTLPSRRLDEFDYAVTTTAAYQSLPAPNWRVAATTESYVLWERSGPTPRLGVLAREDGAAGVVAGCPPEEAAGRGRDAVAVVTPEPVVGRARSWDSHSPFEAPGNASQTLQLGPGRWRLAMQYHSQVDLHVGGPGLRADLPASLTGMYLTHQGQGAFWPVGEIKLEDATPVELTVAASHPSELEESLEAPRRVWLGDIVATRRSPARRAPLAEACGRYVDHFAGKASALATVAP